MRVEAFSRFVQISIEEYNPALTRILNYAKKHFQQISHLSSSILILDDGARFKKDYFITWVYHLATQGACDEIDADLDPILEMSYLPIRIKILSTNALVECVNISFRILGTNRAVLILDRPNHIAKRYIGAILSHLVISSDLCHIYLDTQNSAFWSSIMDIIGRRLSTMCAWNLTMIALSPKNIHHISPKQSAILKTHIVFWVAMRVRVFLRFVRNIWS